ncbi:hypothetical protein D3C72_1265190 [compost metagenome]
MRQRPAQVPQPVRLAHQVGMQRNAHYQRLRVLRIVGLRQHLVELVDDHVGKGGAVKVARDDHRDVVQLLRIGNRPQPAAARGHAHRAVIVRPVQRVAIAGLGQQVRRHHRLRDPRRQPAAGRPPAMCGDALPAVHQQCPLARLVELALAMGVGVAMADQLVAACQAGVQHFGAMVVQRGVQQHAGRHLQPVEQFQAAPHAHPVAVLAPAVVEHVRLRRDRPEVGAQPLAKGEVLDIEAEVDRQPRAIGPAERIGVGNRPVRKAAMVAQRAEGGKPGGGLCGRQRTRVLRHGGMPLIKFAPLWPIAHQIRAT